VRTVAVIGNICSGKSTLAQILSDRFDLKHIELDSIYWLPEWGACSMEVFKEQVSVATVGANWIVDGNYSLLRPIYWDKVRIVIWLNIPFRTTIWRLAVRSLKNILNHTKLWNGNTESLSRLFSRSSPFIWAWKTNRRRVREFPELLSLAAAQGKLTFEVRNDYELGQVVDKIGEVWSRADIPICKTC